MRIAFVVADWTEMTPGKSSTLAMIREAVARGHQTYIL
tara:strand:+ start:242 stop:355 length:114 start_codon:yes stop_codon:yes gene_type:complete